MGCASSKIESKNNPGKNAESSLITTNTKKNTQPEGAATKEEETEEKMNKLFDCASENHPTRAILDETRAKDVLYVYLQSFRLRHFQQKEGESKKDEDKGPPRLSEYKCELMMRKKAGGKGNKDINTTSSTNSESILVSETNDYRDEWISLGTKEFCCGVSGSLVPYLPRANSNEKNDKMSSIMKPMNCAPVWPIPGAVELSTAFRVKVFSKDMVDEENIAAGDVDEAAKEGKKRDESEQGAAAITTPTTKVTNATVNALVEDAKKSFLEENGRASPDLIKKSMGESGYTEDAEEPMESLLVDPRLDEIFNENKKSDGSLGCVLFTLSTLLPPRNDRENAEKKTYEDNDTSSSTTAGTAGASGTASPPPKTTTTTTTINDSPTMGGRRDSGELVVLDSKVCYFDVGYRGVVSTLAAAKFTDCFENQGVSLDSITCKHYCKEMKLDSKAIQAYTKGGFLSVLKLKKMLDPGLSPYASPSSTPRLSLDVFRKSSERERERDK